jgi:hypothetical protein
VEDCDADAEGAVVLEWDRDVRVRLQPAPLQQPPLGHCPR